MKLRGITRAAAAGAVCASLAFAATASAGVRDVRHDTSKADAALERAESLLAQSADRRAAAKLRRANVHARRAGKDADRVRRAGRASRAERLVSRQFDQNIDAGVDALDEVAAGRQDEVVEGIGEAVPGRDHAISVLTDLLPQLPAEAVPGVTDAITAIASSSEEQLDELVSIAESDVLTPEADEALEGVIEQLTASVATIVEQLDAVAAQVPPEAQPYVEAAADQVEEVLNDVVTMLDELFDGLPGGPEEPGPPISPPVPVQ